MTLHHPPGARPADVRIHITDSDSAPQTIERLFAAALR